MSVGEKIAPLIGRWLISLFFVLNAWDQTQRFDYWASVLAQNDIASPPFMLALAISVQGIAGLGLLLGYRVQAASLVLFAFTVTVSVILHDFWRIKGDAALRHDELQLFIRNMAIAGGLLVMTGLGGGGFAMDNRNKG